MKEIYIDIMEKVVMAYTLDHIRRYTHDVEERGIEEHGFPRLVANLGILIAHGRKTELTEDFVKMMNLCCREIPVAREKNGNTAGNDFSVKEVVLCILELEKAGTFPKEMTDGWREDLSKINPYLTYSQIASYPPKPMANWAAFGAFSEQVRKFAGIGNESFFIENQIESQFHAFDENGMYRDPGNPMVYDFVTRLQLAGALYFGFDGKGKERLEEELLKSADRTLYMQSVTGEIPFGGRSNQFLHNETVYSALCEFYASYFKRKGDLERAGKFKRAARIAIEYLTPWLRDFPVPHIKNFYPMDSMFGCETYAYYDKYMITTASWLYLSYVFADDSIEEVSSPSECENYISETSADFHMLFGKFGDYYIQVNTDTLEKYDANGLGRVHRKGAPSAICLSVPFPETSNYKLGAEKNPSQLSICAGMDTTEGMQYSCTTGTEYTLINKELTEDYLRVAYKCENNSGLNLTKTCTVYENGVEFKAESSSDTEILFPAFMFDGKENTEISVNGNSVSVFYKGWECRYETDGIIADTEKVYYNRNGKYKAFSAKGKNEITLKIEIKEVNEK